MFEISNFSHTAKVFSNSLGLFEAYFSFHDGHAVSISSQNTITNAPFDNSTLGQAFQDSHWEFANIDLINVKCYHSRDCDHIEFASTRIGLLSVMCGSSSFESMYSCRGARFNNYDQASFNLDCDGEYSCANVDIQYHANEEFDTSCAITCRLNEHNLYSANCENMTILVENSQLGYDAISLTCETDGQFEACDGVTVICGNDDFMCSCPVLYDSNNGMTSLNILLLLLFLFAIFISVFIRILTNIFHLHSLCCYIPEKKTIGVVKESVVPPPVQEAATPVTRSSQSGQLLALFLWLFSLSGVLVFVQVRLNQNKNDLEKSKLLICSKFFVTRTTLQYVH
ncbi:hypothetical protein RFI_24167 [Reticulomyxa filosa]|uniref:Uncharacterized protein n=1 Tax=Reticulomyxa filosa TaxID=46433 RepID=X6MGR6_RETFI|nr:hypothetical protein RFI_24167 [Reticulomyxa filosa]|eukprot:ETO13208.1 hypothetical protein RFI_24167 [Reticulomyxa filosa]